MKFISKSIFSVAVIAMSSSVLAAPQEVRIATHVSDVSPLYATAQMFAKEVSGRLPEQFEFKFYPNGQLGKENALISNARLGSIEMIIVASGVLKLDGKLGIFDLPWLFKSYEDAQRIIEGEFGEAVEARIEERQNVVVLGIYPSGFRHVINNVRAIKTPSDMEGLLLRVTGSDYKRRTFSLLGAEPVPVAWQETFTAIQQGVVDGAEASLYAFYGAKIYEITDYISLTKHTYTPSFLIASKSFWNSLTDKQRQVLQQVADDITDDVYEKAEAMDQVYLDKMQGKVSINAINIDDFSAKVDPVYESYVEEYGTEWLDMVRSANSSD